MRKELAITLGAAVLFVVVFSFVGFKLLYGPWACSERTIMEKTSPDGRYVAVLMRRSCMANEPPTAHINLRLATSAPFPNHFLGAPVNDGEVFGTSRYSGERFCWSGPRRLEIDYMAGHTKHPGRWMDVTTGADYSLCQ